MSTATPEHLLALLGDTQAELDQLKQQVTNLEAFAKRGISSMTTELMGAIAVVAEMIARTDGFPREQVAGDLETFAEGITNDAPISAQTLLQAARHIRSIGQ